MIETLVGVIVGFLLTYLSVEYQSKKDVIKSESHAASLIYYDLKSLEDYLVNERSSVNLRYNNEWQTMIANCSFLKDSSIKLIYKIYDKAYNYNDFYAKKRTQSESFVKADIPQYDELREIIFVNINGYIDEKYSPEYDGMLNELQQHIK